MTNLIDKTVLITGGSKGIGRALAIGFSRAGWRVAIIARNEEGLSKTYDQLTSHSKGHFFQSCDISVWSDCLSVAEQIEEHFGYLNLLINNAFGYGEKTLDKMDPGEIHDLFETSTTGTALITKSVLGLLIKAKEKTNRKSQIVNIVADWGIPMHNIFTGSSIYVSAKYALHGFGVSLHAEVAPLGINVTNVYPGIVASELDIDDDIDRIKYEYDNTAIPLKDLFNVILACTQLDMSVVRHLVLSPDNPKYNGL